VDALVVVALAAATTGLAPEPHGLFGDFDAMLERRVVRVLVPYSRTLYFNDRGAQRGLTADTLRDFEIHLNKKYARKNHPIVVVAIPTTRERLFSGLAEGRGDLAAGNLTVTSERDRQFDFSSPIASDVAEIVVGGPRSPKLASLDDLAEKEVHVRASSSYYASLEALNARLKVQGKPPAKIVAVPEALEDEDLMDMAAAGLVRHTIVDNWKARIWARLHPRVRPRYDLKLTDNQSIGWAFRTGSPKLASAVNEFLDLYPSSRAARLKAYPAYLAELGNATADADWKRFQSTVSLFKKYSARYKLDYLMTAALGYQESRFDQNARSDVGAIGVMQLMPETGAALKVGDITQLEPNIHGGVKYLRQLRERYIQPDGLDEQNRTLFAIASYNAGPARIAALREEAPKRGLDPNVWFGQVEYLASERIGLETVLFVRNIYKYYIAYKLQLETLEARRAAAGPYAPKPPPKKAAPKK
jgi:membrane-bound lytic murein transglycosylase MltF